MESDFTALKNEVADLKKLLQEVRGDFYKDNYQSKQIFSKDIEMTGNFTQTSVNPTTSFGLVVTPAVRQSAITAPTGGATVDTEARNAINSIRTVLTTFGLTL